MEHVNCPRCLFNSSFAKIGEKQCEYCQLHDTLEAAANPSNWLGVLKKVRRRGRRKQYDCLIGISGGLDSSTLLYAAKLHWRLRPLVIHFDNGWNSHAAELNIKALYESLDINVITYKIDKREYDELNWAFLEAGVADCDIPNDIAMTKLMYDTAHKYGIKYILNGHDFRTEGSTPRNWTYMDAKYIQSVYENMTGEKLRNYPLFTFWDQIYYGFKGIKQVRPFHYMAPRQRDSIERTMKNFIGWSDYGGKHAENLYTEFVGSWWLPKKHGIDKRIVYLSARVRSGLMTREEAERQLSVAPMFNLSRMPGSYPESIQEAFLHFPVRPRTDYARYNFKRWRIIIWLLMKLGAVPKTFYIKYAK